MILPAVSAMPFSLRGGETTEELPVVGARGNDSIKIYCPTFWPNGPNVDHRSPTIRLADLLPAVGSIAPAYFERNHCCRAGETVWVIWCPSASDLNGWEDQPSEIATSYLLKAHALTPKSSSEPPHPLHLGKHKYDLEILACERLLPALRALPQVESAWSLPRIGTAHGVSLAWNTLKWCGTAAVEGLTYLAARGPNEAYMELILEESDGEIAGLFSMHANPGGISYNIGRKRFDLDELRAVRHALSVAQPLQDSHPTYLTTES
jgi:hypothetical protein